MRCRLAVFALVLVVTAHPLPAGDHLDAELQAKDPPEHVLSGINVYSTTISEAIKLYGKPTRTTNTPEPGVPNAGTRDYFWENGAELMASTTYLNGQEARVYNVEVRGDSPNGGIGVTGRGLPLGADLQKLKAVYGSRFFVSSRYDGGAIKSLLMEWKDGTQLEVYFDQSGRIEHLQLIAQVE